MKTALCIYPADNELIYLTFQTFNKYRELDEIKLSQLVSPRNGLEDQLVETKLKGANSTIPYFPNPPVPDDRLKRNVLELLEKLERLAMELEIDVNFSGDSHKFSKDEFRHTAPFRDSEYDLGAIKGSLYI